MTDSEGDHASRTDASTASATAPHRGGRASPTLEEALTILRHRFTQTRVPPRGYVRGRTRLRDAIAEESGCSLSCAERLVDQLEHQRKIRYTGVARVGATEPPERWIV